MRKSIRSGSRVLAAIFLCFGALGLDGCSKGTVTGLGNNPLATAPPSAASPPTSTSPTVQSPHVAAVAAEVQTVSQNFNSVPNYQLTTADLQSLQNSGILTTSDTNSLSPLVQQQ